MPNPTKRAAQVKARRMWLDAYGVPRATERDALNASLIKSATPVFQLPADRASRERMREQVARSIRRPGAANYDPEFGPNMEYYLKEADAALSSLGLTGGRKG